MILTSGSVVADTLLLIFKEGLLVSDDITRKVDHFAVNKNHLVTE